MNNKNNLQQNSIFTRWVSGIIENQKAFSGSCIILFFALVAIFLPFFINSPTDFLGTPLSPPSLSIFLEQMVKDKMYSRKLYAEQGKRFLSDLVQAFLL